MTLRTQCLVQNKCSLNGGFPSLLLNSYLKDVYFYDYRHPQVVGIKKHGYERDTWYKNLKIKSWQI